jgi:peroxiredoxin
MRMPRVCFGVPLLLWLMMHAAAAAEIGSKVGNFQLPDITGTPQSMQSHTGKIIVLFFWSFKCPVSLVFNNRIEAIQHKYRDKPVVIIGIASAADETQPEIRANADNLKITMPILIDEEGNLAEKLGATHAPSVFILDGEMILRYKGALDNNRKPGEKGRMAYAENAIDDLLAGRSVSVPETRPFGCNMRLRNAKE